MVRRKIMIMSAVVVVFVLAVVIVIIVKSGKRKDEVEGMIEYLAPSISEESSSNVYERLPANDLHDDVEYIKQHEDLERKSDGCWEPPENWELPRDLYERLDSSIISVLGSTVYEENVKWQYALYEYFGEGITELVWIEDAEVVAPSGVNFYWVLVDSEGNTYVTWIDAHYGFVKKLD